jgi:D-beta-D-heptose 7-phosphate kinase / D-beta-D-heptose 1-phosphate adenosyltransferase
VSGPLVLVGDTLLDLDTIGSATRLSPDSPVPVLEDLVEEARPGGAGLAALMASRDGAEVVLITAVADDASGARLAELLEALPGLTLVRLPTVGDTPVKHRVRAGGQSVVRLDTGGSGGAVGSLTDEAAAALAGAGAVLVADYGRGVAAEPSMRSAVARAASRVPVTWDPHPRGTDPVPGCRLVTPNRAEAVHFAGRIATAGRAESSALSGPADSLVAVRRHAEALVRAWKAHAVAVTLGEQGALLSYGSGVPAVVPAPMGPAPDPCGAGDRLAVSAALSLARGAVTLEAVQDGVLAAAAYVAEGGPASLRTPAPVSVSTGLAGVLDRVRRTGGTLVATGGCFDLLHAGHVATLHAARRLGDALVVCLNSDDSIRRLKGPTRPLVPATDRRRVLEAMEDVDAVVVFDEDTPEQVLRELRPDVWAKGGDYAGAELPEASVLEEWGGQAVVLPYLPGRSTTGLVDAVRTTGS